MNLTPEERAAMVKDLERLISEYENKADSELFHTGRTPKHVYLSKMKDNYSALASALKEGLTFEAVA
jgi:hypothetical protein